MDRRIRIFLLVFVLLVLANLVVWSAVFALSRESWLKVVFFDVGQGMAVFVEMPQGTQILIDGGPSDKILEKLAQEMPFFDRRIDLVISTHPDFDHLSGLVEVLKSYEVNAVAWTGVVGQTAEFREFMAEAEKERADKIILKRGQRIQAGSGLSIDVLAPLDDFEGRAAKDTNVSSLVLKMTYGLDTFMLMGDAPVSVERELLEQTDDLEGEVLQVGHHGSKSSTSQDWLETVIPEVAVIQVGKDNKYGHPSPEVLERLQKYGIKVMRTDEVGDIKIMSDGKNNGFSSF